MQATTSSSETKTRQPTGKGLATSAEQHYHTNVDLAFIGSRQRLLSRLIRLSDTLQQRHWDIAETLLHQFCQELMDYLELGHDRAFANHEPDPNLYVAIASTTRTALSFTDRFCRGTGCLPQARPALEQLALALETRFELEDDLQQPINH